jgi:hypothetical protein
MAGPLFLTDTKKLSSKVYRVVLLTLKGNGRPIPELKNQHMKSKVVKLAFLAILMVGAGAFANTASAQVYVSVHPAWHTVVRPVAPSHDHVWIGEDWESRNGTYVAVGGHWALPPHRGWVWHPGHWRRERRGEYWIAGHWGRR